LQRESNRIDKFRSWLLQFLLNHNCLLTSAVIMTCHPCPTIPASVMTLLVWLCLYWCVACRRRIYTNLRGSGGSRQTLANSAMHTTLQSTQRLCRSQGLRSQSVNARAPCFSCSPRLHTLCRGHLRHSSRQFSAHTSLAGRSPQVCRASQPEASIDQDSDLVGEDAAFFD